MSEPLPDPRFDLDRMQQDLEVRGFCILPELIPRERIARIAARLRELMRRESGYASKGYVNLHGVFDALEGREDVELPGAPAPAGMTAGLG